MNLNERTLRQLPKKAEKPEPPSPPPIDMAAVMSGIELQQRVLADTMATIAKLIAERKPVRYVVERGANDKIKAVVARPL